MDLVVATVCFNDSEALSKTLLSGSEQTSQARHLVIDGGSSDNSVEVLKSFESQLDLKWISEPDRGLYHAMNKALDLTPDDSYIWFINAGDTFASDRSVQSINELFDHAPDTEWILGRFEARDQLGHIVSSPEIAPYSFKRHAYWKSFVCHQAVIVNAAILKQCGGFDERLRVSADFDLMLKVARRFPPVVFSEVLVHFATGGLSHQQRWRNVAEQRSIRRMHLELNRRGLIEDWLYDLLRYSSLAAHDLMGAAGRRGLGPRRWSSF